jgi:hypothetical protein
MNVSKKTRVEKISNAKILSETMNAFARMDFWNQKTLVTISTSAKLILHAVWTKSVLIVLVAMNVIAMLDMSATNLKFVATLTSVLVTGLPNVLPLKENFHIARIQLARLAACAKTVLFLMRVAQCAKIWMSAKREPTPVGNIPFVKIKLAQVHVYVWTDISWTKTKYVKMLMNVQAKIIATKIPNVLMTLAPIIAFVMMATPVMDTLVPTSTSAKMKMHAVPITFVWTKQDITNVTAHPDLVNMCPTCVKMWMNAKTAMFAVTTKTAKIRTADLIVIALTDLRPTMREFVQILMNVRAMDPQNAKRRKGNIQSVTIRLEVLNVVARLDSKVTKVMVCVWTSTSVQPKLTTVGTTQFALILLAPFHAHAKKDIKWTTENASISTSVKLKMIVT